MRRRSLRPEPRTWAAQALVALSVASSVARAEGAAGNLDAHARLAPSGRHGAGVSADALWGGPRLRGGLTLGLDAVRAAGGETSAVLTPVGLAGQVTPWREGAHPFFGVRAGAVLGAQQGGFFIGPFGAATLGYVFPLGEAVGLRAGFEVWGAWSASRTELWLAPGLGLAF
jgi:hypothetical protein